MTKLSDDFNEANRKLEALAHMCKTLEEGQLQFKDGKPIFYEHQNPTRMKFEMETLNALVTAHPELARNQRAIHDIAHSFFHPMVCYGAGQKQDDFSNPLEVFTKIFKVDAPKAFELIHPVVTIGERPPFPVTEEEWDAGIAESLKK